MSTSGPDYQPSIAADGLMILWSSGATGSDIGYATRQSVIEPFGPPQSLADVNTLYGDFNPALSADGLTIYFVPDRPGGAGSGRPARCSNRPTVMDRFQALAWRFQKSHNGFMRHAKISELRNGLSRYLAYVRQGGVVRVFDRERAVADIVPVGASRATGSGALDSVLDVLEQQGVVRRGDGALPSDLLTRKLPRARRSVVDALVDERRSGR